MHTVGLESNFDREMSVNSMYLYQQSNSQYHEMKWHVTTKLDTTKFDGVFELAGPQTRTVGDGRNIPTQQSGSGRST